MGSRDFARRDVLKVGAGLASVGAIGLSGCSSIQDGSAAAADEGGDDSTTGGSVTADVPARANVVAETDFQALLNDDPLRNAVNDGLSAGLQSNGSIPTTVEGVFDSVEEKADVDPRRLQQTVLFGEADPEETAETDYAGYLVYSNWSGDLIRGQIQDLREESSEAAVETEEYGGQTVYVSTETDQVTRFTVFDDGTVVAGGGGAVTDVVDVRNGEADPLSGDVLAGWNAASDGYVRFAFDVDPAALPEGQAQMAGSTLESVKYTYGSIYPDGDVRGIAFNVEVGSEEEADQAVTLIEQGLLMAAADAEEPETRAFIEDTQVAAEGTTVTVRNEVSVDEIVPVVREFVRGFASAFSGGRLGTNTGSGNYA
jgi:hypothetical protein